jgi:hypothetical protein
MRNEEKIVTLIDRALDHDRAKLTPRDLDFLTGVRDVFRRYDSLSMAQKNAAVAVLKRIGRWTT